MPVIDADTHVDESEDTWAKLEGTPYAKYIPVTVTLPPGEAKRAGFSATNARSWLVEGRLQNRAIRDEVNHPPRVRRELADVPGRLAGPAAVHPSRPSPAGDRMGPGLSDHPLPRRDRRLQAAGEVPEAPLRPHRGGGVVDSLLHPPTGRATARAAARPRLPVHPP